MQLGGGLGGRRETRDARNDEEGVTPVKQRFRSCGAGAKSGVTLRDSRLSITRCEQPSSIGADVSITCSLAVERERAAVATHCVLARRYEP